MRPFVIVILVIYALVLIAGALHFLDKFLRKISRERHYTFHNFEKNSKKGFTIDNDKGKHLYYAVKTKEEDGKAVYKFTNGKTKHSVNHRISGLGHNSQAPNFTNKSFLFDDTEAWEFLKKHGIAVETTAVDENMVMYKIKRNDKPIAYVRKRKSKNENGNVVYTTRTYERNIEPIFMSIFTLAQTEKHFDHFKKTKLTKEK